MESGIQPVTFFGDGQCPLCNGPLMVLDRETCCMLLGEDGMPLKDDTIIQVVAICQTCGATHRMMRHGFGYRLYSNHAILFEKYDELKKRLEHTTVKENPFVYHNNEDGQ